MIDDYIIETINFELWLAWMGMHETLIILDDMINTYEEAEQFERIAPELYKRKLE